jgi:hypothetical protein
MSRAKITDGSPASMKTFPAKLQDSVAVTKETRHVI